MKKRYYIMGILLFILAVGGTGVFLVLTHHKNPIPHSIREASAFPIYYPASLPTGWKIQENSFTKDQGVVIYSIVNSGDSKESVSVSVQPQPKAFNFDKFYKETLAKSTQFTTSLGSAAIGEGENNYRIGSITTGDSWVLITSSSDKVTTSDLRLLLTTLKN